MRKIVMLLFVMIMFSILVVPAFAQTGAGAAGSTNWVAITSGFAIAIAAGLAAQGQGRAASAACDLKRNHELRDLQGVVDLAAHGGARLGGPIDRHAAEPVLGGE